MTNEMLVDNDGYFEELFIIVPYNESINISITKPMKESLKRAAAKAGLTVSDIVRQLIATRMGDMYPDYDELYDYFYKKEIDDIRTKTKGEK